MTFIDGPRRCIGYKLAVMEIKTVIFTLLREFEIELMEGQHIFRWNMSVIFLPRSRYKEKMTDLLFRMSNRPFVANTLRSKGSRLPLHFKLYKGEQQHEKTGGS